MPYFFNIMWQLISLILTESLESHNCSVNVLKKSVLIYATNFLCYPSVENVTYFYLATSGGNIWIFNINFVQKNNWSTWYSSQLWWNYNKCSMKILHVAYYNVFRMFLKLPKFCTANEMSLIMWNLARTCCTTWCTILSLMRRGPAMQLW